MPYDDSAEKLVGPYRIIELPVRVDRSIPCKKMVEVMGAMGWSTRHVIKYVLINVPVSIRTGVEKKVDFVFFCPGRSLKDEEIKDARITLGLEPDAQAQTQANKDNHQFAAAHPNGYGFEDKLGNRYRLAFCKDGSPSVIARKMSDKVVLWPPDYWFGGRRKAG